MKTNGLQNGFMKTQHYPHRVLLRMASTEMAIINEKPLETGPQQKDDYNRRQINYPDYAGKLICILMYVFDILEEQRFKCERSGTNRCYPPGAQMQHHGHDY